MNKFVLITSIIVILFFVFSTLIRKDIKMYPSTIKIVNETSYTSKLDTILMCLSHDVFGYDTLEIKVYNMIDTIGDFYAYFYKLPFYEHSYLFQLVENIPYDSLKIVLCHEFIHISQLENNEIQFYDSYALYKGDTIPRSTPYEKRQFEIDAFNQQDSILNLLNKYLE